MRRRILLSTAVAVALAGALTWAAAPARPADPAPGAFDPQQLETWTLTGPDAHGQRVQILRRAALSLPPERAEQMAAAALAPIRDALASPIPSCRFLRDEPSGSSAKFDCVFDGGAVVKVKYGRNPEVHAEPAATTLLRRLGYPTDAVVVVPRLRCYGCPRYPFLASRLQAAFGLPLLPAAGDLDGYTEFEWVAVERKFPAPEIEIPAYEGWGWWELKWSDAPRPELDRLRLAAIFFAHWDNKADNQRLVCVGDAPAEATTCARPLAMIQDLGATFGPTKLNLAQWRRLPVWQDRAACRVSMEALPFDGGTFPPVTISEEGRRQLAEALDAITREEIARIFAQARFPDFQIGTDDRGDLEAWVEAFRSRVRQIVEAGPCPAAADLERERAHGRDT